MPKDAYTQSGQFVSSVGLYQRRVRKLITTKAKPVSVMRFGLPAVSRAGGD